MSEPKEASRTSALPWLLGQTGGQQSKYLASVLTAIVGVACRVAPYFVVARIISQLMAGNREAGYYLRQCGLIALLWAGQVVFHAISTTISHKATFAVLGDIRKRCTDKLARMPLGDVLDIPSGALKSTIVERIDAMETTLAHIVPEFTSNLLAPICLLICLFAEDWRMALAALITVPLGFACYMGMMVGYEPNYQRTVRATRALNDVAVEYIHGIEVIKVFGKAESSYQRFVAAAHEGAASYVDWMRKCNLYFTFGMCIMPTTLVSVLPIGCLLIKGGSLTPETFVSCIILSLAIIDPLITCMSYTDDIGTMSAIVAEVRNVLDAPEMERPDTAAQQPANNTLQLEDVHFAYHEKEVLHGISLTIPEGSVTALVGPSGSGKSTIARLISSLWDVKSGRITLGGVDLKQLPLDDLNSRIAYVSQDNYLFNRTIRENIRMGRQGATDAEVEAAARRSGCHGFIMSLENGYDTVVGSSGGHLSGGERQRITIARAMLKDAPIVILDEATAYTDPENEAVIQRSVAKLVQGKTLIVIAHRLSTIRDADCIYVVKDGCIAEHGTHEALLAENGLYSRMWAAHISAKDTAEEEPAHA